VKGRRLVFGLAVGVLLAAPAMAGEPDFARVFAGRDGCFELYDLTADKLLVRSDPRRCAERTSPCSTFKVPLALMAYDQRVLVDESSSMKWDGTKYSRESWNHDQTATTWMQNSVVWFSQRLTPRLGMKKVKRYLTSFGFGNGDMSGGLTKAWLESSLLISADEQLGFWKRFWREELPVSKHAFAMTKKITLGDSSPAGFTLHGKTGSGTGLGWYAGHLASGGREYVFVATYTDRGAATDDRPPGWIARDLAKSILAELGLMAQ
jgi:beta-lactamase class D